MEKERSIKELLQLLKEYLTNMSTSTFTYGLCGVVMDMDDDKVVSFVEERVLRKYLHANSPSKRYREHQGFWWRPGNKAPRIKWLTEQINKL